VQRDGSQCNADLSLKSNRTACCYDKVFGTQEINTVAASKAAGLSVNNGTLPAALQPVKYTSNQWH
jgi:hypothetical protein